MPRPLAHGLPFNLAVHQSQLGSVCTAERILAPAGTPGGPEGGGGDGELDCEELELASDDCIPDVDAVDELEDDDSAGCIAGSCVCGCSDDEAAVPPQPARSKSNAILAAITQDLHVVNENRRSDFTDKQNCISIKLHVVGICRRG